MTEEEATTKWCPAVRLTWVGEQGDGVLMTNRLERVREEAVLDSVDAARCVGRFCMLWTGFGCGLRVAP